MPVVAFLGDVRKAAGRTTVDVRAGTVAGALSCIESVIGPRLDGLVVGDGALAPDIEVLVNGRNVEFLDGLATRLEPTDRVTIFYGGLRGFPGG